MTVSDLPYDEDRRYTDIMRNTNYTDAEKRQKLTAYARRVLNIAEAKNSILRNLNKLILGETNRLELMDEVMTLLTEKQDNLVELSDEEALALNAHLLQVVADSALECRKERDAFQREFKQTDADVAVCKETVELITTFLSTLDA